MTESVPELHGGEIVRCFNELMTGISPLLGKVPNFFWLSVFLCLMGLLPFVPHIPAALLSARLAWRRFRTNSPEVQFAMDLRGETMRTRRDDSSGPYLSEGYVAEPDVKFAMDLYRAMVPGGGNSFIEHLLELRWHVLRVLSWMLAMFLFLPMLAGLFLLWCGDAWSLKGIGLAFFNGAGSIYGILAVPLLEQLPESGEIIAIGVASPVFVPVKAAFFVAACVTMPYALCEMWRFVAPGLYDSEKGLAIPLIASSVALFYAGVMFAYLMVFRVVFGVIAAVSPEVVNWMPDVNEFFGFMLTMFFMFGLVFEVPVAVFILVRAGIVEMGQLKKARRYVIVGAFVVAAIVTPPDVLSQFMLAIPCWLLYELGLWFAARWGVKKKAPSVELSEVIPDAPS